MTDVEQAAALELIGGKRQANILSSLISNFQTAEEATKSAADSAGSALAENEKVLDRDLKEEVSFENINILLVEDNELNLEIAKFLLSQTKANILEARNGKEAIDIFENSKDGEIDVILMDIFMPVVDGIEATKAIRNMKKENSKSIPIIAMSANTFSEDVERALSAGMNDMLQKPINTNQLFATIQKFLKKKGD